MISGAISEFSASEEISSRLQQLQELREEQRRLKVKQLQEVRRKTQASLLKLQEIHEPRGKQLSLQFKTVLQSSDEEGKKYTLIRQLISEGLPGSSSCQIRRYFHDTEDNWSILVSSTLSTENGVKLLRHWYQQPEPFRPWPLCVFRSMEIRPMSLIERAKIEGFQIPWPRKHKKETFAMLVKILECKIPFAIEIFRQEQERLSDQASDCKIETILDHMIECTRDLLLAIGNSVGYLRKSGVETKILMPEVDPVKGVEEALVLYLGASLCYILLMKLHGISCSEENNRWMEEESTRLYLHQSCGRDKVREPFIKRIALATDSPTIHRVQALQERTQDEAQDLVAISFLGRPLQLRTGFKALDLKPNSPKKGAAQNVMRVAGGNEKPEDRSSEVRRIGDCILLPGGLEKPEDRSSEDRTISDIIFKTQPLLKHLPIDRLGFSHFSVRGFFPIPDERVFSDEFPTEQYRRAAAQYIAENLHGSTILLPSVFPPNVETIINQYFGNDWGYSGPQILPEPLVRLILDYWGNSFIPPSESDCYVLLPMERVIV